MKGFRDLLRGVYRHPLIRKTLLGIALFIMLGWCVTGLFQLPGYGAFSFAFAVLMGLNMIRLMVKYPH
jgi:hypothetical protein